MYGHDHTAPTLSRRHYAGLHLAPGASGTIRGEGHCPAGLELAHRSEQGPGTSPRARASNRSVSQCKRQVRQVLAFPCLAHDDGDSLMPMLPQEWQQGFMPEQKNVRTLRVV